MNQPVATLIEGLRRALRDTVAPELSSDHARSQLAGVLDVLSKVERMLVWSPDVLLEQLEIAQAGLASFAERTGGEGPAPLPARAMRQQELAEALQRANAMVAAHAEWVLDPETPIDHPQRRALDALLRETMRHQLLAERRLIPRADFGAMTAGAQRTKT